MKSAKGLLIAVGVVSVVLASVGLWYNLTSLSTSLSTKFADFVQEKDIPYFYPAFYVMSAICIVCYTLLLLCGIQFLRLRTGLFGLFAAILIFEVVYFFSISTMWLIPKIGMSVASATGVANGGLMYQAFILFPLWAPFLVGWARKRISKSETQSKI